MQNSVYKLEPIRGEVDTEDWVFREFESEEGEYVGTLTIKNRQANIKLFVAE